jgi:hypothetical protein
MATDRQQVERLEAHRTQLLAENKLGFPPAQGSMAIFTVYDHAFRLTNTLTADTLEAMDREAVEYNATCGGPGNGFPIP